MGGFAVVNGQVFTPGLAMINAPQPYTPLGGDNLHIAVDVSGNGKLPWPPSSQASDSPTLFHDITLFLTSYSSSRNLTISNGTAVDDASNSYVNHVLDLEPSSTVKHVNWIWPACLVGDGDNSDRGQYNISMHQFFRWNGSDYYTVFDLPISVSNGIEQSDDRVDCATLNNELQTPAAVMESNNTLPERPWVELMPNDDDNSESGASHCHVGIRIWLVVALLGVAGIMQS